MFADVLQRQCEGDPNLNDLKYLKYKMIAVKLSYKNTKTNKNLLARNLSLSFYKNASRVCYLQL